MTDEKTYKIPINKDILTDFLLSNLPPDSKQMEEVIKVFTVVLIKHFSNYLQDKDDLFSYAWVGILSKRKNYDPSFSSYNYIYTISRNEIGNAIKRYSKEELTDDLLPASSGFVSQANAVEMDLPPELNKYKKYLTGEQEFDLVELPPLDAFYLIVFILSHTPFRKKRVPDFIKENPDALEVLFKSIHVML